MFLRCFVIFVYLHICDCDCDDIFQTFLTQVQNTSRRILLMSGLILASQHLCESLGEVDDHMILHIYFIS